MPEGILLLIVMQFDLYSTRVRGTDIFMTVCHRTCKRRLRRTFMQGATMSKWIFIPFCFLPALTYLFDFSLSFCIWKTFFSRCDLGAVL